MGQLRPARPRFVLVALWAVALPVPLLAAQAPAEPAARSERIVHAPAASLGVLGERPESIPGFEKRAEAWRSFSHREGGPWDVWLDRRTGVPLLAQGRGPDWGAAASGPPAAAVRGLEERARAFLERHRALTGIDPAELDLAGAGSGPMDADRSILLFNRSVGGIPVLGDQVRLYVVRGRLVAFGATGWGRAPAGLDPALTRDEAVSRALDHAGPGPGGAGPGVDSADLVLVTVPEGEAPVLRLAWRVVMIEEGDPATWVAAIDAATGEIISFEDETLYDTLRGGVYPISNDGVCPHGCQRSFPLPWADVEGGTEALGTGRFFCGRGTTVTTELLGSFTQLLDFCGPLSESRVCGDDLDLGTTQGTDCAVAPGASPGNTAASRTVHYHVNRAQEKARYWQPFLGYPAHPLLAFVNFPGVCNAFYNGAVGYFTSGAGCSNTGEIGGIVVHEVAHGLDEQDGGDFDVPTEGYADVAAVIQERRSCVGPNFTPGVNCSGFGDPCLECTGVREMDWARRAAMTPATPAGFIMPRCPPGTGACGRSQHCESHVVAETIFDLATRDLPAMGIDPDTAWQITERLWYGSRMGSGGKIFNCLLPASNGCGAGNWFTRLRVADDDDGNLLNGTPHAAAIYAAFARHGIACGAPGDPSNQNRTLCAELSAPELSASAGPGRVSLSWSPVPGATGYRVLRTEISCDYSQNVIAQVFPTTTAHSDLGLPLDLPLHYRVQPLGTWVACDGPVSNCVSVASQPFAGTISFDRATYGCSATAVFTVYDGNLGSEPAEVRSPSEPAGESLALVEEVPLSARHVGRIALTSGPSPAGDGALRVADGETITARYVDRDDGAGGRDLLREATAVVDCGFPSVLDLAVQVLSQTSVRVTWRTPEPATTRVRWGEIAPGEEEVSDEALVTDHAALVTGLRRCTRYVLEAESRDAAGNVATGGGAGGGPLVFETPGSFGQGLQQCHRAAVLLDRAAAGCDGQVLVRLIDMDLNLHPDLPDAARLGVVSTTETSPETAFLRETGPNTSTFTGAVLTGPGPAAGADRRLQVRHGDLITATYADADDGTGTARTAFATGTADCLHAGIADVEVSFASDSEAIVTWRALEPSTAVLEWGPDPNLGFSRDSLLVGSTHSVEIEPVDECARIHFRILSTDAYGNKAVADSGEGPLEFNGVTIPGALLNEGFEKPAGWTLEGEWEVGSPEGTGVPPDDPVAALFGTGVLGHDLSGQGDAPRLYEIQTDQSAMSPSVDATLLRNGELRLYRYLNTGPSANASIEVLTPSGWVRVRTFSNRSASTWTREVVDIAHWSDGNADLRIRLRQQTPATLDRRGGWNVDRLVVRDGSLPAFAACGGCDGAPSMEGIASVVDLDPCAASGIAVTWKPAVSWGTGSAGTYAVYRGGKIGFEPAPATLLAAGLTGTSWVDPSPPSGTDLHYLVRAENDESCGSGPANGGLTDSNLRYAPGRDETFQPPPGAIPGEIEAANAANAHVELRWEAAPNAAFYRVFRALDPEGPFALIGEPAGTFFEDAGAGGGSLPGYYVVRAADACGNEGP